MKFPACTDGSALDFTEEVRRLRPWKGQLKISGMNNQLAWMAVRWTSLGKDAGSKNKKKKRSPQKS